MTKALRKLHGYWETHWGSWLAQSDQGDAGQDRSTCRRWAGLDAPQPCQAGSAWGTSSVTCAGGRCLVQGADGWALLPTLQEEMRSQTGTQGGREHRSLQRTKIKRQTQNGRRGREGSRSVMSHHLV